MLYETWLKIVREHRNEMALYDLASGERWTFGQLAEAAANQPASLDPILYPQGHSVEFILTVLQAWRDQKIVCPLEAAQPKPATGGLPAGVAHLKLTSATTGAARMVAFSESQLAADPANIVATMGLKAEWPNLAVISLAHSYGFSNLILPLLLHGVPMILTGSPLPETIRKASEIFPHLTLPGVPALWRAWHDAKVLGGSIRLAISAGAPLSVKLEADIFNAYGLKVHNFYGASECGGIAYDAAESPRQDGSCVGAPMRNVQVTLNDSGCLCVRSSAVGKTYWPESQPNLLSGRYETSDLAEITDGLVYLHGRVGDLINVAGRKIAPESIERVLMKHPAVSDCLVFGVPSTDAERTEMIVACVVARKEQAPEDLKQFLLTQLPAWQVPRNWWFVEALEVNQRGKLSRAQWRSRYLEANRPKGVSR